MSRSPSQPIQLDLNNPVFQRQLFGLPPKEQREVLSAFQKLVRMDWDQLYRDKGLKWEVILSRTGPTGGRIYSLRIGKEFRTVAYREGNWLRMLSLHPDMIPPMPKASFPQRF